MLNSKVAKAIALYMTTLTGSYWQCISNPVQPGTAQMKEKLTHNVGMKSFQFMVAFVGTKVIQVPVYN